MMTTFRKFLAECIYPEQAYDEINAYSDGYNHCQEENREFVQTLLNQTKDYDKEEWKSVVEASLKLMYLY